MYRARKDRQLSRELMHSARVMLVIHHDTMEMDEMRAQLSDACTDA